MVVVVVVRDNRIFTDLPLSEGPSVMIGFGRQLHETSPNDSAKFYNSYHSIMSNTVAPLHEHIAGVGKWLGATASSLSAAALAGRTKRRRSSVSIPHDHP